MARQTSKLSALKIQSLKKPGLYSDGAGLYLRVSESQTKSWIFRYKLNKRQREMGLGSYPLRSLSEAREKATEARRLLLDKIDPIDARISEKQKLARDISKSMSFDECAKAYIEQHKASWTNAKHAAQWESTLSKRVSPVIGKLAVRDVDTSLVLKVLEPIWSEIPESAGRIRNRIETILDWATVREFRQGDNPARWKGHLDKLLPKTSKIKPVRHFAALPFKDMPDFINSLRKEAGLAPKALELLILTAVRSGEIRGARWEEVDFKERVWTIPAARMKAKREHRVPLSVPALRILEELRSDSTQSGLIFEGRATGSTLSDMTLTAVMRRMDLNFTVHGFRSSFRDWAGERTAFPREIAEQALAHVTKDKVEAAYRRGDYFEKRAKLMDAWAEYVQSPASTNVVAFDFNYEETRLEFA